MFDNVIYSHIMYKLFFFCRHFAKMVCINHLKRIINISMFFDIFYCSLFFSIFHFFVSFIYMSIVVYRQTQRENKVSNNIL